MPCPQLSPLPSTLTVCVLWATRRAHAPSWSPAAPVAAAPSSPATSTLRVRLWPRNAALAGQGVPPTTAPCAAVSTATRVSTAGAREDGDIPTTDDGASGEAVTSRTGLPRGSTDRKGTKLSSIPQVELHFGPGEQRSQENNPAAAQAPAAGQRAIGTL